MNDHGRRALHLKSHDENSTITRDINGKVNLSDTPILEWNWKAVSLPGGGDVRHGATDDEVLQVYVDWPRAPAIVRSRIIGYVRDRVAPVGTIVKSKKTRTVTYVVVRSESAELGQWRTERRNVPGGLQEDLRRGARESERHLRRHQHEQHSLDG